jgi:outer membrane protein insertion porin family
MLALSSLALAVALTVGGAAERFTGMTISAVQLTQTRGPVPEEAQDLIDVQAGDPYDPAAVRRSIKQLFALGTFSDIKVDARPLDEGVTLTFQLYPRLTLSRIQIVDEETSRKADAEHPFGKSEELLEEVDLEGGEPFDAGRVEEAAAGLEDLLRKKGFLWSRVEPEVQFHDAQAEVLFHIDSGPHARLSRLGIEGVEPHVEQHLRREIGLSPGDPYVEGEVREKLDQILDQWKRKGFYRAQIDLQALPQPPEQVEVGIRAAIGPRVRVDVEGAELSQRTTNLENHFRERGYPDAAVSVQKELVGDQRLVLKFMVDTGVRLEVRSIRVEGVTSLEDEKILSLLETRPRARFRSSPFVRRSWEEDLKEIRRYLLREGFHRATVRSRVQELKDSPGLVDLVIDIHQGPRAFLGSITVEGARQISSKRIIAGTGLKVGEVLDASKLVGARERIANLYRTDGFREVVVEIGTELDETGTQGMVRFSIQEGAQTRVDRVIVSGLDQTKEKTVRPHITISSEEPLSSQALLETRQRLIGTGLFREVSIEVLPADTSTRTSDVLIHLEEAPRTTVGYGFGYSERDLARVEGEITRHNIFGTNRTASVFARASFRSNRLIFTYEQPDTFGFKLPSFVSAFREEGERAEFKFKRIGVGMQVLKRVSKTRTFFFRYSFEDVDSTEEEVPPEFATKLISQVSVSSVTDTRDDPVSPTRGQFRLMDVALSAKFLGTHSPFIKGLAQQFFYFPLPSDMVFVLALRGGIGQTFREDRDALLPLTERFFAGGANTLRGFGLDQASPKTPEGEPVGGNVLMLLNLELRVPIFGKLGGVVFSDNGNVYRRLEVIRLLNWRYNAGFGFRYETPLGPVRVDYGIKLNPRPTEPRGRLHVSLGHPF